MLYSRPEMLNKRRNASRAAQIFSCVLIVVLCGFFLFHIWFLNHYVLVEVDGDSMQETLQDGDFLYIEIGRTAERGNIIVIDVTPAVGKDDSGNNTLYIKRLIAKGGDVVRCDNGVVSVRYAGENEFTVQDEPYALGSPRDFGPVEVGEGEVFFLGDNRENSKDSGNFLGCLPEENILGVVPEWSVFCKDVLTGFYQTSEKVQKKLFGWLLND